MSWNSKLKEQMILTNHEGDKAYAMTPELELYTAVVTASLSDLFYEKEDERVQRIADLISCLCPKPDASKKHTYAPAGGTGQSA